MNGDSLRSLRIQGTCFMVKVSTIAVYTSSYTTKAKGGHKVKVTNQWLLENLLLLGNKRSCTEQMISKLFFCRSCPFSSLLELDHKYWSKLVYWMFREDCWEKQLEDEEAMDRFEVNTSNWNAGVYFVRYKTNDAEETIKIIKGE